MSGAGQHELEGASPSVPLPGSTPPMCSGTNFLGVLRIRGFQASISCSSARCQWCIDQPRSVVSATIFWSISLVSRQVMR